MMMKKRLAIGIRLSQKRRKEMSSDEDAPETGKENFTKPTTLRRYILGARSKMRIATNMSIG